MPPTTTPAPTSLYDAWAMVLWPILGGVVVIFGQRLWDWARTVKFGKSTRHAAAIDLQIQDLLTELRIDTKAMRAYLSKFHNGEIYADGSHIQKKTRTHESVARGVSYQAEQFNGRLTSSVPEEMELIHEPGPGYRLVADLPSGMFRWLCEQGGVGAIARYAVHKGRDVVAFVGLDFAPGATGDTLPDEIDRQLPEIVRRIENVLAQQK